MWYDYSCGYYSGKASQMNKERDNQAIREFKNKVISKFPEAQFILFGSKARKENKEFSDIDVLVILKRAVTTDIERSIFGIGFETGLSLGVVFGIVVEQDEFWNSSLAKAMPFYQNVIKEGAKL